MFWKIWKTCWVASSSASFICRSAISNRGKDDGGLQEIGALRLQMDLDQPMSCSIKVWIMLTICSVENLFTGRARKISNECLDKRAAQLFHVKTHQCGESTMCLMVMLMHQGRVKILITKSTAITKQLHNLLISPKPGKCPIYQRLFQSKSARTIREMLKHGCQCRIGDKNGKKHSAWNAHLEHG